MKPDIVIVGGKANQLIYQQLSAKNISLVFNIKPKLIAKICRATRAKVVDSLAKLNEISVNNLGTCKSIQFKTLPDAQCPNKDPTLMVLEFPELTGIVTIFISGSDIKELKELKSIIKHSVLLVQHLWLEKDLVIANSCMLKTLR